MPLRPGRTQAVINGNIRELIKAGKPRKQAIAIAMKTANKLSDEERAVRMASK
jgi:hypothetical protein